jgi:hypothetical protein
MKWDDNHKECHGLSQSTDTLFAYNEKWRGVQMKQWLAGMTESDKRMVKWTEYMRVSYIKETDWNQMKRTSTF